jgi:hypothetical protein
MPHRKSPGLIVDAQSLDRGVGQEHGVPQATESSVLLC